MRTFQFSDAKSHKFWNIEVSGSDFTVHFFGQSRGGFSGTSLPMGGYP
jgi:predicted DNA-binding WGR domain protein